MADRKDNGSNALARGLPIGLAVGMGVGVSLGVALGNIALGTGLGAALGISLSLLFGNALIAQDKKKQEEAGQDTTANGD